MKEREKKVAPQTLITHTLDANAQKCSEEYVERICI